ncbi:MAG: VacJ family lipoprotein [Desulfobacterales bacterium]|nr:VacJ family lipoprotein [Desulfobacterales bacterium]
MVKIIWPLLLAAAFFAGCAHKPDAVPSTRLPDVTHLSSPPGKPPGPPPGPVRIGPQTPGTTAGKPASDPIDKAFMDESLDFLKEETQEPAVKIADPIAPWNRLMFHFNDKLYFWLLKPVSQGYRAVVPTVVRGGIKNFFHNLTTPVRFVSSILQGNGVTANAELSRFLINTTIGVLGFGDPATKYDVVARDDEDLGQTLATYGIGNGFFIVWPLLGPSSLRDSVGIVGNWFLNPVSYVPPAEARYGITGLDTVNQTSFRLGDYEILKQAAIDPYEALRNAYIQHRTQKIKE